MKTLMRTAVAAAALATATAACTSTAADGNPGDPAGPDAGQRPVTVRLVAYRGCDEMLAGLREHAAENVGPWGFGGPQVLQMRRDTAMESDAAAKSTITLEHSTTNTHEVGVDEPDVVKTDGRRVITVTGGTLRVIDVATRKVTATLRLTERAEPTYAPADLLLSGDRALVLMRGGDMMYKSIAPMGETRYVLVDLAGAPKVLGSVKPQGSHVDARMVGSTVRLVTRSQPEITFPEAKPDAAEAERTTLNRAAVRKAPVEAWLPKVEITDASGAVSKRSVPCERVSHPADYTGTSLLTVHSIDLAQGLTAAGTDPIGLAADGDIVYGTGQSLYVASNPRWWWPTEPVVMEDQAPAAEPSPGEPTPGVTEAKAPPEETEVHRFDVTRPGAPVYAASGKVAGRLLNQYALSEHDGHLRVATTTGGDGRGRQQAQSVSGVHVLRASDMTKTGEVGGLGKGERIYSVRFIGPVGYVVTFRQVDPLYTLDLRDPAAPKVTGELKITGYSAYLHPAGEGRLIGIGQEASEQGRTLGTQVSLFDVGDPANPRRLSQLFQKDSGSDAEWEPHAFLYWPKTGLAVVPLHSFGEGRYESGALALKIDESAVTKLGMITHPETRQGDTSYRPGIQRTMVIGDGLWTLSDVGVQVNDATSLAEQAWIPFTM
ncbi:beta-propeller domain-containing protein [Nonomuraea muscovyensis]|uniref:beta-propeller domain-containing protein n=1 Tax=Nonomuraea muscovyensis TaxID=1124761 RepID=UPI0033C61295